MQISYNIDDYGILRIYLDRDLHAEISDCANMSEDEIDNLIDEALIESYKKWNNIKIIESEN